MPKENKNTNKNKSGYNAKMNEVMRKPRMMIKENVSANDPNGSYTGAPMNKNEKPVQDADDL